MSESFLKNGKSALVVLLNTPCHNFIAIILKIIYCHLWYFFCTMNHLFRNEKLLKIFLGLCIDYIQNTAEMVS